MYALTTYYRFASTRRFSGEQCRGFTKVVHLLSLWCIPFESLVQNIWFSLLLYQLKIAEGVFEYPREQVVTRSVCPVSTIALACWDSNDLDPGSKFVVCINLEYKQREASRDTFFYFRYKTTLAANDWKIAFIRTKFYVTTLRINKFHKNRSFVFVELPFLFTYSRTVHFTIFPWWELLMCKS